MNKMDKFEKGINDIKNFAGDILIKMIPLCIICVSLSLLANIITYDFLLDGKISMSEYIYDQILPTLLMTLILIKSISLKKKKKN